MLQTNHLKNVRRIVWYTSQIVSCYYLIHTALRISYFAVALEQGYRLRHKLRRNTPLGVQTHTSVSTPSLRGSRQCKSRDLISSPQLPSRIRPVRCYLGGPASGEGDRAISVGTASWRKSDHPIFLFFCFVHTFANSHVISWKEQQVQIFMQRYKELFYTCNARAHEYDFSWRQFISVQDEKNLCSVSILLQRCSYMPVVRTVWHPMIGRFGVLFIQGTNIHVMNALFDSNQKLLSKQQLSEFFFWLIDIHRKYFYRRCPFVLRLDFR